MVFTFDKIKIRNTLKDYMFKISLLNPVEKIFEKIFHQLLDKIYFVC